jgi:hypothetical protein
VTIMDEVVVSCVRRVSVFCIREFFFGLLNCDRREVGCSVLLQSPNCVLILV